MPSHKALARMSRPKPRKADSEDWDSDSTLIEESLPIELDEAWPYAFQKDQEVWVKTAGGLWCSGRVTGTPPKMGQTRLKGGLYYRVVFNKNLRKDFAPLNGEIKPDDAHTRSLLKEEGWLP
ncbi:hypothetical protein C0991_011202 [Blastosporella zonata]|nr:hypothetical protein C0991_011202 [Blastosporella zonata]